ncbi:MAG: hypothetical protein PF448_06350 [Bacteroidales bacterium]|jgi:hypothetical protein|nr:hypothetical protein [Bacteroidales bacterium]
MSSKYARVHNETIEDMHGVVTTLIKDTIPGLRLTKTEIACMIEIASHSDNAWQTFIPRTNIKNSEQVKRFVEQTIQITKPHAVRVTIWQSASKIHSAYIVKLVDKHVKLVDDDANELQEKVEKGIVKEEVYSEPGLGAFGTLQVNMLNREIDKLKEKHQEDLSNFEDRISQRHEMEVYKLKSEKQSVEKELKLKEKEVEDLENDYAELYQESVTLQKQLAEKTQKEQSGLNGLMAAGVAGLASKFLGVDISSFEGLNALNGDTPDQTKQIENAGKVEIEEANERDEEIAIIKEFLREAEDDDYLNIITILQAFKEVPSSIDLAMSIFTSQETARLVKYLKKHPEKAETLLELVEDQQEQENEEND